jgi:hypothetical protein
MDKILAACLMLAAQTYSVPPAVLVGIQQVEGGTAGQSVGPNDNMGVAAWILRGHMDETGSLSQAIAHYHSRTPKFGGPYKGRVVSAMRSKGLLRDDTTR